MTSMMMTLAASVTFGLIPSGLVDETPRVIRAAVAALEACPAIYDELGIEPEARSILFKQRTTCLRTSVAETTMGGSTVWLCPRDFNRAALAAPEQAVAAVAHEILHTQGLPEAPSTKDALTSRQINKAVWGTCEAQITEATAAEGLR